MNKMRNPVSKSNAKSSQRGSGNRYLYANSEIEDLSFTQSQIGLKEILIFNQSKRGSIYENGSFNQNNNKANDKTDYQNTNNTELLQPNRSSDLTEIVKVKKYSKDEENGENEQIDDSDGVCPFKNADK